MHAVGADHDVETLGRAVGKPDRNRQAIVVQGVRGDPEPYLGSRRDRAVAEHLVQRPPADPDIGWAAFHKTRRGHLRDQGAIGRMDRHEVEPHRRRQVVVEQPSCFMARRTFPCWMMPTP
jgi:hypothetical protein